MASTTLERVRGAAGHLTAVSDLALTMFIEDAQVEVAALNPPEAYQERLERYLAIHFASVKDRTVLKEKLDVLEKTYADTSGSNGILSTPFGAEYDRLLEELGLKKKRGLNLTVF